MSERAITQSLYPLASLFRCLPPPFCVRRLSTPWQEWGVENITFQGAWSPYPGHFKEPGFNFLAIQNRCVEWWIHLREAEGSE